MGKVVNFGGHAKDLDTMVEAFDLAYDKLKELYNEIDLLETKCKNLQKIYDKELRLYARRVGAINVPIKYLEHTTHLKIDIDTGELAYDEESGSETRS